MNVKYKKYINYIVNDIEPPYLKSLEPYGLKHNEKELVLSKVYNQPVTIEGKSVYDQYGNEIYYETSNGSWYKREYDSNGNQIYYEDIRGYWYKREYDANGNKIYSETSNGYWTKREYDSNGNLIYQEDSTGNIVNKRYERQI
jgi:hypothetical protein